MNKTRLMTVGMADILWHMKTNKNIDLLDHMAGQFALLPIDPNGSVTERRTCFIKDGFVSDGVGNRSQSIFGVTVDIDGGNALVQYAGYAEVQTANPVVGEYAYAEDDGRASCIDDTDIASGAFNPRRIIGRIVEEDSGIAGVMLRSRGIAGYHAEHLGISSYGMAAQGSNGDASMHLMSMGVVDVNGVIHSQSNVASATVSGNVMTVNFTRNYATPPRVRVGCQIAETCITEIDANTNRAYIRFFNLDRAALTLSSTSGRVNIVATGESA